MERKNLRYFAATGLLLSGIATAAIVSSSDTNEAAGVVITPDRESVRDTTTAAVPTQQALLAANAAPTLGLADSVIETFHDSDVDLCGTTKVKQDGPVRVFEDQFNVIHMTVSDADAKGWQWHGSVTGFTNNPKTAVLDCDPVMIGNVGNTDPSKFDQKTWIQAFYFDGTTAWAYGHQDFWGNRVDNDPDCHRSGVTDGKPGCWYASIAAWKATPVSSANRHLSFSRDGTAPSHTAIFPHVQYPGDASTPTSGWIGYGAPSNIFRGRDEDGTTDGYWYMFAYTNSGYAGQAKGLCLFRTSTPAVKTSWRAWNGNTTSPAFTQAMTNPYPVNTNTTCAVVQPATLNTYVRSVIWHKPSRHYVGILRKADGVYYTTSTNMLSWSTPTLLLTADSDEANYPTMIDFDGGDWGDDNFDRAYDNGKLYLFYRKKNPANGNLRITRRKIDITNYSADAPGSGNPG